MKSPSVLVTSQKQVASDSDSTVEGIDDVVNDSNLTNDESGCDSGTRSGSVQGNVRNDISATNAQSNDSQFENDDIMAQTLSRNAGSNLDDTQPGTPLLVQSVPNSPHTATQGTETDGRATPEQPNVDFDSLDANLDANRLTPNEDPDTSTQNSSPNNRARNQDEDVFSTATSSPNCEHFPVVKTEHDSDPMQILPLHRYRDIDVSGISSVLGQNQTLNQTYTYTYEDVEMAYDIFPKPMMASEHELIKRDDDPFSGNIPYNTKVSELKVYLKSCDSVLVK